MSCQELFFKLLLPVVRLAGEIELFDLLCQNSESGWYYRLFCTPTWVILEFGSSCFGFKHSNLLPVQTRSTVAYSNNFFFKELVALAFEAAQIQCLEMETSSLICNEVKCYQDWRDNYWGKTLITILPFFKFMKLRCLITSTEQCFGALFMSK